MNGKVISVISLIRLIHEFFITITFQTENQSATWIEYAKSTTASYLHLEEKMIPNM